MFPGGDHIAMKGKITIWDGRCEQLEVGDTVTVYSPDQ